MSSQLTLIRFLLHPAGSKGNRSAAVADDDAAEGAAHGNQPKSGERGKKKEKSRGQNTNRNFGVSRDEVGLCASRANSPEFSPGDCRFGDSCKFEHDLRKYLMDWKRKDLKTFGGICPIWYVSLIILTQYYISTFRVAGHASGASGSIYSFKSLSLHDIFHRRRIVSEAKGLCLPAPKLSHYEDSRRRGNADSRFSVGKRKVNVTLASNVVSSDHT